MELTDRPDAETGFGVVLASNIDLEVSNGARIRLIGECQSTGAIVGASLSLSLSLGLGGVDGRHSLGRNVDVDGRLLGVRLEEGSSGTAARSGASVRHVW